MSTMFSGPSGAIERWLSRLNAGVEWIRLGRPDAMGYKPVRDAYGHVERWAKPNRRWRDCSVTIHRGANEGWIVDLDRGIVPIARVKILGSQCDAMRVAHALLSAFL